MQKTHLKTVISNKAVETYEYEKPVWYGSRESILTEFPANAKVRQNTLESRNISNYRTKRNLRRLAEANAFNWFKPNGKPYMPTFLTLTFAKDIRLLSDSNILLTNFMKRLSYKMKTKLQYIAKPEFHIKGKVHYHIILFNFDYLYKTEIAKVWKHGFIKIEKVDSIRKAASYVSKYLTKNLNDDRFCGQKAYSSSRGLKKPVEISDEKIAQEFINDLNEEYKVYENEFDNEHCGKFKYKKYLLP